MTSRKDFGGKRVVIFGLSVLTLIAILWFLGWYAKRWVVTDADYLLAGRQVSLIPGIAGICGIAFAGSMTSIIPGLTIQYGFMGWILGASLPLILGYILYGLLACPYIRRCGAYTLPEWLEMRFDTRTRIVVSIATLLGVTGIVAMNIVAMALIMTGFLAAPLWLMITIVLCGHLMFILLGGLWALTLTDVVQVLLGFLLLPALVVYCFLTFGGWDIIQENFVSSSPFLRGSVGSFPWLSSSYPSVLTIFLVLGIFIQRGKESPCMDVLYRCCCGLDVHAQTVVACLIKDGQKQMRTFSTMTDDLLALKRQITCSGGPS